MSEKILMCGNDALSEAAIIAGVDAYFGYPITPQNEVPAYMARRMPEEGRIFLQSESELAAINMVFGAAAAGKLAMTSSSSPGISLMQEGISYMCAAQMPAVIVNVMRGGPGLGNISPAQGDYFQATRGGGHGDYRTIVLAPGSVQELADLTHKAFELADLYRIVVLVLADGLLGQMMEPITLDHLKPIKTREKPWALTGAKGRRQNIIKTLLLQGNELEVLNLKLQDIYRKIEEEQSSCDTFQVEDADIVLVAYGITAKIARAAVSKARGKGIKAGWVRPITLWPFPSKVLTKLAKEPRIFLAVEMSHGQMVEDVRLAVCGGGPVMFYGRAGGAVPTVDEVLEQIEKIMPPDTAAVAAGKS